MLLSHFLLADRGVSAVFSAYRHAIAHEVLEIGSYVVAVDMVGVGTLHAEHCRATHLCAQIGVFAIILPYARPARVSSEVDGGIVSPGYIACAGLVGGDFTSAASKLSVESGTHVYILRKQSGTHRVARSVVHVKTVDTGDAEMFHRVSLNL